MLQKKFRAYFFEKLKDRAECFDVRKANKMLFYRDQNHKINLMFKTKFRAYKIYNLIKDQIFVIKTYINKILEKNFIRSSLFNYTTSILVIKKFKKDFCVCVDYRALNVLIIKDRNCPSLIREILVKLCAIKYYIKLNVIIIFIKIRIRENDEEKTAFQIRYELYKYVVMLFGLYNAFDIFQFYINEVFREYLNDFCITYLNNILIYSNIKEKHTTHIQKILNKLYVVKFFLNINKCKFYVNEIKYLKLIIIIESIKIDFEKIQVIFN